MRYKFFVITALSCSLVMTLFLVGMAVHSISVGRPNSAVLSFLLAVMLAVVFISSGLEFACEYMAQKLANKARVETLKQETGI